MARCVQQSRSRCRASFVVRVGVVTAEVVSCRQRRARQTQPGCEGQQAESRTAAVQMERDRGRDMSAEILELPDMSVPPGLYALADLPQRGSVSKQAFGAGWPELDQIFKL